ncbi:hypothetical protein [Cerasicoccus arenae]|uniref:Uncharacterized protein n=1 Tax=Cerasicoccus arenae TaxID=424488 RepID=A0A8J3DH98_9BACT|nr:hypothetical protein [Cerasicoccus arenae]MBK1858219.1 hypothetical protein [Cerasicoccus arenae]GHC01974.1 hypothetical protein GCM10007047_18060 [Cerasicoccus arenae]
MKRRNLSYATNHPYFIRAQEYAREHDRPLSWSFWDLQLYRPYRARDGVELLPPIDPQSCIPGHEFQPVEMPPTPEGWKRVFPCRGRAVDTPLRAAASAARATVPPEGDVQEELF